MTPMMGASNEPRHNPFHCTRFLFPSLFSGEKVIDDGWFQRKTAIFCKNGSVLLRWPRWVCFLMLILIDGKPEESMHVVELILELHLPLLFLFLYNVVFNPWLCLHLIWIWMNCKLALLIDTLHMCKYVEE
jgi:hypothetical protein